MHIIKVRNVQSALPEMLCHLDLEGVRDESRYGNVIVAPTPVTTVYTRPWERVIFWSGRDANPTFHLLEALYLLAGRRDVEWLAQYNSRMREFSDDGKTFHGSYGYRWRHHFGFDQLEHVVTLLQRKPRSRRAVIQIWDCEVDLYDDEYPNFRDIPCLAGDTLIMSPEGDVPIEKLAVLFKQGKIKRYPVYSADPITGDLKLDWCRKAWKSGKKHTITLSFEEGGFLTLTPDHIVYRKRYHGCYPLEVVAVKASELQVGDSIVATRIFPDQKGYLCFKKNLYKNTRYSNRQKVHTTYEQFINGPLPAGFIVHHDDDNRTNNKIDNLVRMTKGEHDSLHRLGDLNPMRRMSKRKRVLKGKAHSKKLKEYYSKNLHWAKKLKNGGTCVPENHKIASISDSGVRDVYDFTVNGNHTALVQDGILVHNCNDLLFVWRDVQDKLCMTVCCRSNDAIWGAAGTNSVQFSILQEYLAAKIGVGIGALYQISNNLHAYLDVFEKNKLLIDEAADPFRTVPNCPYTREEVYTQSLVTEAKIFDRELKIFMEGVHPYNFENSFLEAAKWIRVSYFAWKEGKDYEVAYECLARIHDDGEKVLDWKRACIEWLRRREYGATTGSV